jgi:hypothetical protein
MGQERGSTSNRRQIFSPNNFAVPVEIRSRPASLGYDQSNAFKQETKMQYLALLYTDPAAEPAYGTPEFEELMKGYFAFTAFLKEQGAFKGGDGLQPVETATSVRLRDGKVETMDGPFAETKEYLGGYYLMEVPDLDTALKYAAMIPTARYGTVELRPVMVF